MSTLWTAVMGIVVRSTKPYPELADAGNAATRRRSISTSVAPGSRPRSASAAVPDGPAWPVPLLLTGILAPFITGCLCSNCSVVVPAPDLLIRSRLILNTGFAPTSSAVGINDPVTTTRSTSAAGAAPPAGCGGAPPPGSPEVWADVFGATMNGNPAPATSATRTNPSLFSTFLIISFSIDQRYTAEWTFPVRT